MEINSIIVSAWRFKGHLVFWMGRLAVAIAMGKYVSLTTIAIAVSAI